jgi:hypothetical protein
MTSAGGKLFYVSVMRFLPEAGVRLYPIRIANSAAGFLSGSLVFKAAGML